MSQSVTITLPDPLARRLHGWIARTNRHASDLALDQQRAVLVLLDEALERAELSGILPDEVRRRLGNGASQEPT